MLRRTALGIVCAFVVLAWTAPAHGDSTSSYKKQVAGGPDGAGDWRSSRCTGCRGSEESRGGELESADAGAGRAARISAAGGSGNASGAPS